VIGALQCLLGGSSTSFQAQAAHVRSFPDSRLSLLLLLKSQTKLAQDRERLRCPPPALYEFCQRSRRPRRHAHYGGGANGEPDSAVDNAAHGMMSLAWLAAQGLTKYEARRDCRPRC
jgi:hypothetical protein